MTAVDKRRFLAAATGLAAAASQRAVAGPPAPARARSGAGLLTVVGGAVGRANRGPLDKALDQLMVKHGVAPFDRACEFDAAMLARLLAATIEPTLEYDGRPHRLRGPLLSSVLAAAGVSVADGSPPLALTLRALDGYAVGISLADARRRGTLVATAIDGRPLALGGLGPVWASTTPTVCPNSRRCR